MLQNCHFEKNVTVNLVWNLLILKFLDDLGIMSNKFDVSAKNFVNQKIENDKKSFRSCVENGN